MPALYGNTTSTLKNLIPALFSSVTGCHSPPQHIEFLCCHRFHAFNTFLNMTYCISYKKYDTITTEPLDGLHPPAEALPMRRKAGSNPGLSIFKEQTW